MGVTYFIQYPTKESPNGNLKPELIIAFSILRNLTKIFSSKFGRLKKSNFGSDFFFIILISDTGKNNNEFQ